MKGYRFNALSLALLTVVLLSALTSRAATTEEFDCDPAALEQRMGACGMDLGCINQLMTQYSTACMAETQGESGGGTGSLPGIGGGTGDDPLQRLRACGNDPECIRETSEELRESAAGSEESDLETTRRLSERTVMPAAWLQSYQEACVACEKNVGCWMDLMAYAAAAKQSVCGSNLMSEAVMVCQLSALYEIHIEQAIAQQRLWRKGIRFEGDAPGANPPDTHTEPTPSGDSPAQALSDDPAEAFSFLPEVSKNRVAKLLKQWKRTLEERVPQQSRDQIAEGAEAYPLTSDEGMPPLIYEEQESGDGLVLDARPTRRDWYYALTGVMLTHAGLMEGGDKGRQLLDAALWCLIQAAQMKPEAEHFSNIGFHLNLLGEVESARDILVWARKLDPSLPDASNNLAFSYSALGKPEEALALQRNAARLGPDNGHIRSRLESMEADDPETINNDPLPYGGDFGEAFFRLGKRHTLREWEAGKRWFRARENTKSQVFGGSPVIPGPHSWYAEQLRDIDDEYSGCIASAPEVARGCPFGAGIVHPDCADAASPEEVARTQNNRNVFLCQCAANALMAKADALCAYLDRAIAVWVEHEKAWWPRLQQYAASWAPDIRAVNQRYEGTGFVFPLEAGYSFWTEEFAEDSKEAWGTDLPEIAAKWHELKEQVQNLKSCGSFQPKKPENPSKPKPSAPPKVKSHQINLFVVQFQFGADGSFKFGFDLGVFKASYERIPGVGGHKFTAGSGPLEFSYQHNSAPKAGGDTSVTSVTVSTSFYKWIPGAGQAINQIAGSVTSFGAKYEIGWGNKTGFNGQSTVEAKSKFGYTSRDVTITPATSMLN